MLENEFTAKMFDPQELRAIRDQFCYVDTDIEGHHRIFMDNAGGSLRLKAAQNEFTRISEMPDASGHSNELALKLRALDKRAIDDIKNVIFGTDSGVIYPGYTASQIMMDVIRIFGDNAHGTNYVTTMLEHPSCFDAMAYNAEKHGCELRVAQVNQVTGGVDAEEVLSLIDEHTAILSCMAASNISGYIYDLETICHKAREINPDILIICDTVQHAPHGVLDPVALGVDMMNFAPYKFFGVRGLGLAWLSDRVAGYDHYQLLGKPKDDWAIGSSAPAHYASMLQIIEYVVSLGRKKLPDEDDRRTLYAAGMQRIADHERGLLYLMLEGTDNAAGLRHMDGVTVRMDGKDLTKRDLILGIELDNVPCEQAVDEYDKRGVVTFNRSISSVTSRRMLEAFGLTGVIRLSPIHVNSVEDIEELLTVTKEIVETFR